jgi:hypothetical protein
MDVSTPPAPQVSMHSWVRWLGQFMLERRLAQSVHSTLFVQFTRGSSCNDSYGDALRRLYQLLPVDSG